MSIIQKTAPQGRVISVPEAAKILGIGRRQAYRAVQDGEIPAVRIGRRILVPLSKLNALIEGDQEETW